MWEWVSKVFWHDFVMNSLLVLPYVAFSIGMYFFGRGSAYLRWKRDYTKWLEPAVQDQLEIRDRKIESLKAISRRRGIAIMKYGTRFRMFSQAQKLMQEGLIYSETELVEYDDVSLDQLERKYKKDLKRFEEIV